MNQVQKMAPAWHEEARKIAADNFAQDHANFLNATKRAVWWGMFFNHIKFRGDKKTGDGSIPHGEFGPWLKKNVPEIPWRTANTYMSLATGACEKGHFEIRQFSEFAGLGELPPKISKMIDGHTQQELFLQFKNVDADGEPLRPGCKPGKRGPVVHTDPDAGPVEVPDLVFDFKLAARELSDEKNLALLDTPSADLLPLKLALTVIVQKIDRLLEQRRAAAKSRA